MQLPTGFHATTWERMLVIFKDTMPTLAQQMYEHLGLEETEARAKVLALEQKKLVQFAVGPKGDPAMFSAPIAKADADKPGEFAFSTEEYALADAMVTFWDVQGEFDHKHGKIVPAMGLSYHVWTPEGPMSVVAKVANRLHQMGLIQREGTGQYTAPSKAKLMEWTAEHGICDFCSDGTPKHIEMVPDHYMEGVGQTSVGGWATCETCHTMIIENRRTDLFRRGLEASVGGKYTAAALKSLHKAFWTAYDTKVDGAAVGAAVMDFINGTNQSLEKDVSPAMKAKTARAETIRRLTGLTQDEMDALGKGDVLYKDVAKKLSAWRKRFGIGDASNEQRVAEMLDRAENPVQMPSHLQPHWQQALDQKVSAITWLATAKSKAHDANAAGDYTFSFKGRILEDILEDLTALKVADVYSFNADTMHAIMVAAASIPHEAALRTVEVPMARAGFYWFAEPYPVASSPISSDVTHAVLWMWDTTTKEPTIRFSAYVVDEKAPWTEKTLGQIKPSSKWVWPLKASFHDMIALTRGMYDEGVKRGAEVYGEGKEGGLDVHLNVVSQLSLFFMQSCQWFRQTVPGTKKKMDPKLTQTPGHIERHARKRYEKEFKTKPTVHVIALRKSDRTIREEPAGEPGTGHKLKVRFVVSGHHRLQRCGPGLKDEKLIWIESYPKGPDDAPFQPPRDKVFAVIR